MTVRGKKCSEVKYKGLSDYRRSGLNSGGWATADNFLKDYSTLQVRQFGLGGSLRAANALVRIPDRYVGRP